MSRVISPALLVPGWTGFNITIRKNVDVIESKITYLDRLESPFDQAFHAKVAEILWKHKEQFKDIVLMLGGFHLLMMFLGTMGTRQLTK